jgi:hypothetical protein
MAQSTCVNCHGSRFEVVVAEPRNTGVKLRFIKCADCGGVVGAMDFHPLAFALEKLAKSLGVKIDWKARA